MKTDPAGQAPIRARLPTGAAGTARSRKPPYRGVLGTGVLLVTLALTLILGRHAIEGFVLPRALSALSGDNVSFGTFGLGREQSAFSDVHITTRAGRALLDARRIAVRYRLRDLVIGGAHRFGLFDLELDAPTLTLVRRADGSYDLGGGGSATGGAVQASRPQAPVALRVRVRAGAIRFVDEASPPADLARQELRDLTIDAQIVSDRRSTATGRATLLGRRTQSAPLQRWPLYVGAVADVQRGIEIVRVRANRLPVRGFASLIAHSNAVRIDDGLLTGVDLKLFALNLGSARSADLHVGGRAELLDGRIRLVGLQAPVRGLHGRLTLVDDGIWTTALHGTLGGIPLAARGGAYDRHQPALRLGVAANGDLADLRSVFAFAQHQPVSGRARVRTLLEAPLADLLIRTVLSVDRGMYGAIPVAAVRGRVDYHAGAVVLDGVRARYGATRVALGGRVLLGGVQPDSALSVWGSAFGRSLPYAENLVPEGRVEALAVITGRAAYRARGSVGVSGSGLRGLGTFAVDERGVGQFGPFAFTRSDGSSLVGALRLERPTSRSAAWLSARGYRVEVPAASARLPGLNVPSFPPVAGVVDAELAGGGSPDLFGLAGRLRGRALRLGKARLGSGQAQLGGTLGDVRLSDLALAGPLGRFAGDGSAAAGGFALRGRYDGSLERLTPLTGQQNAHGAIRGPVLVAFNGGDVMVQSTGARLQGGAVRGVRVQSVAGTIAIRGGALHVVAADGLIAGRRAVAREIGATVAFSAPDIPAAALRGTGLPLERGEVSAYGVADLRSRTPSFDGTLTVADGITHGYHVAGDAQIDLDGPRARIFSATGALGSTYGSIGGSIEGIGATALRYDVSAHVPLGDVDLLRRDLGLRIPGLAGSFAAKLHVNGSGTQPFVEGTVAVPEGAYHGLAFRDGAARVGASSAGLTAFGGTLTIGSTRTVLGAGTAAGGFDIAVHSDAANLADFNDYFDAGDTLRGRGAVDLRFRIDRRAIVTRGALNVRGLSYRNFPIGDTVANWGMQGSAIAGRAKLSGAAGTLEAAVSVVPAAGGLVAAARGGRYTATATFARIDLGTWMPALGLTAPVLGSVDGRLTGAGRLPQLALNLEATLADASIAGIPVRNARLRTTSRGSRVRILESHADTGFARFDASGMLGLSGGDPLALDVRAETANVGLAARQFVPAARGFDLAGALQADVRLGGTLAKPKIEGGFQLTAAHYLGLSVPRTIGALALAGNAIELRDIDIEFPRGQAFVAGSLPLIVQPFGLGPAHAPVSFDVTVRSVDLAQFAAVLPAGTTLGGALDGRFGVEGTVDGPRLFGSLAVVDGSYRSTYERAPIQAVNARLSFDGTSVALQTFHAGVGQGELNGSGRINLPFGRGPSTAYRSELTARGAQFDFPAYGHGTIDGALHLTSGVDRPLLDGTLNLSDAVIPAGAVYDAGAAGGAPRLGAFMLDPALAIHAVAAHNVRVRSGIIDIGVVGAVDLNGTLAVPRLAGAFAATDGTVSSYNHLFRVVNAAVTFDPADGVVPTVEARAIARVSNPDPDPTRNIAGSANITVAVSGLADGNNLAVTYSSDPAYSQEQIVGLLLDVPALLGAVNFDLNHASGGTLLRGAPGETNVLLPPGVTPEQVTPISLNQEVFSLLNGQLTQRALTPVERVFEKVFGLSDLQFTVDYGGGIGYSLRRQIGKRDFFAFLSQTVTYPERLNVGFELVPQPYESINFSYYHQDGITSLITNQTSGGSFSSTRRLTSVQPLGNRDGFSLNFSRRNW